MSGHYEWIALPGGGAEQQWVEDGAAPVEPVVVSGSLLSSLGWVNAASYAVAMDAICPLFDIVGPQRLACWLGQTGHESGRGKWRKEIWGPTPAQKHYEGRADLGNLQPGDGARFRGRGIIQVTGRYNYTKLAQALGISLGEALTWLETLDGAVAGSAWWWREHGCNELADQAESEAGFRSLTKRINGGQNGADDRRRLYLAALHALS